MRAGQLREKITIQATTSTPDSWGDVSESWSAYAANVPATVAPLRGRELIEGGQPVGEMTHRIYIRYSSDVSAVSVKHRILYGSRVLDIRSVANVDSRDRMIELLCSERV